MCDDILYDGPITQEVFEGIYGEPSCTLSQARLIFVASHQGCDLSFPAPGLVRLVVPDPPTHGDWQAAFETWLSRCLPVNMHLERSVYTGPREEERDLWYLAHWGGPAKILQVRVYRYLFPPEIATTWFIDSFYDSEQGNWELVEKSLGGTLGRNLFETAEEARQHERTRLEKKRRQLQKELAALDDG